MSNRLIKLSEAGMLLTLLFSACLPFKDTIKEINVDTTGGLRILMEDAYQGVKDGNVEWVPLPERSAYITVEICVENSLTMDRSVQWQDIFITTEDHAQVVPVAVGYDEAEAFGWLLPIAEPIGGERITHRYYFFLIQNNEIMKIPAHQSLGCNASPQFKSLALLFIVPESAASRTFTLHFLEGEMRFEAKKILVVSEGLKRVLWLGISLILIGVIVIVIRKKQLKAQVSSLARENNQSSSQGEL